MPVRKPCAECGHDYNLHRMRKMVHGKEKSVPCSCTQDGCTCQVYIAPETKKGKKRSHGKKSGKVPVPREITLPLKARVLKAVLTLELTIGDQVIQSEVEIPGDQLK